VRITKFISIVGASNPRRATGNLGLCGDWVKKVPTNRLLGAIIAAAAMHKLFQEHDFSAKLKLRQA